MASVASVASVASPARSAASPPLPVSRRADCRPSADEALQHPWFAATAARAAAAAAAPARPHPTRTPATPSRPSCSVRAPAAPLPPPQADPGPRAAHADEPEDVEALPGADVACMLGGAALDPPLAAAALAAALAAAGEAGPGAAASPGPLMSNVLPYHPLPCEDAPGPARGAPSTTATR